MAVEPHRTQEQEFNVTFLEEPTPHEFTSVNDHWSYPFEARLRTLAVHMNLVRHLPWEVGPEMHGYVYVFRNPGLWKCGRGSDWSRAGEVLFIFEKDGFWVAADAEECETESKVIAATGQALFRTAENALALGWYTWESNFASRGHTEWRSTGLSFETTRLQSQ